MLKDLDLSQQAAKATDAATPLGEHAAALFADFVAQDPHGLDFSAMLPWLAGQRHKP
jgi:3-hydroxyisobutyrate dehydrogenase